MPFLGLRDMPLEDSTEETLGLGEYAEALSDFIQQCETPLTIALQGDWGSGKTSLMNVVKKNIERNPKIQTIWFNTWQYSQFRLEGNLAFSLLTNFIDELAKDDEKGRKKQTFGFIKKLGKAAAIGGAAFFGQAEVMKAGLEAYESESDTIDAAKLIKNMKDNIQLIVSDTLQKGKERIVVFIDDLDRLLPEKAVELLEVFKLFLDIHGCVYVLACDYQVIEQGLEKKFGVSKTQLKGKSFFDKIIQLPFSMPLGQYQVNNYIQRLLEKIGMKPKEDDVTCYADMLNYSIGFNPRSIKRLFNSLLLLNLVATKKGLFEDGTSAATKSEKQRIMFGALCLQMAYEPVYRYLQKHMNNIDQKFFKSLMDINSLTQEDTFLDFRKEMHGTDDSSLRRLSEFMGAFFGSIQLESDDNKNELSVKEIEALKDILLFSSLTSTEAVSVSPDDRYKNRDMAKVFSEKLNQKYADYLGKYTDYHGNLNSKFAVYQSRKDSGIWIYCWFNFGDKKFSIEFVFDTNSMKIISCASNQSSRDFGKIWFENNYADIFSTKPDFNPKEYNYAKLFKKEFDKEQNKEDCIREYQETVIETLDKFFPKLITTIGNIG